jgi:hypothetical protein
MRWLWGRSGEQAPKLGDEVIEVLLRAQALPFEHFHNRGHLLRIGDGSSILSLGTIFQ